MPLRGFSTHRPPSSIPLLRALVPSWLSSSSHFLTDGQKTIDFSSQITIVYMCIFSIFDNQPILIHTDRQFVRISLPAQNRPGQRSRCAPTWHLGHLETEQGAQKPRGGVLSFCFSTHRTRHQLALKMELNETSIARPQSHSTQRFPLIARSHRCSIQNIAPSNWDPCPDAQFQPVAAQHVASTPRKVAGAKLAEPRAPR